MATTALTTLAQIRNRLSADGVTYRLDDVPPDADDGDTIDEASQVVYQHCLLQYEEASLAASPIVARWACNIACFLLCERRGNAVPTSIRRKYETTMEQLARVQSGALRIGDTPTRTAAVPVVRQGRHRLDPHPRHVIEPTRSTGTPEGYASKEDTLDYEI